MTREEASNILDDYDVNFDGHTAEEIAEAFEVAFRALEQEPCPNVISRSDMLDAIGHGTTYTSEDLQKIIKGLPPVTPQMMDQWQELKETIIEMRDNDGTGTQQDVCKFLVNLMDVLENQMSGSEIPNSSDCISRQAALDKKELIELEDGQSFYCISPEDVETLPSVNPQPKTGHWIHFAASDECSECGWSTGKYNSPSKYCPNCGIKMIDVHDTNVGKLSEIPTGSESEVGNGLGL